MRKDTTIMFTQIGVGTGVLSIAFALTDTWPLWAAIPGVLLYCFSLWKNY